MPDSAVVAIGVLLILLFVTERGRSNRNGNKS